MIVTGLMDMFINIILTALETITLVPLPVAFADLFLDILCFGTWVVGADFMVIFLSVVTSWFLVRFTLGVIIFLWELLPLT